MGYYEDTSTAYCALICACLVTLIGLFIALSILCTAPVLSMRRRIARQALSLSITMIILGLVFYFAVVPVVIYN